ncbi:MAG: HAD-IIIC family phosphatase [Candidatus Binataceae bacterium]
MENSATWRVAILRSSTLEPALPLLEAEGLLNGITLQARCGGFNNYTEEILGAKSWLYDFEPKLIVLAIETRDILPELWDRFADISQDTIKRRIDETIAIFQKVIAALSLRTSASLLIHTFAAPSCLAMGVLDSQAIKGQNDAVYLANQALRNLAREHPGVYILDYDALVAQFGRSNWWDEEKWLISRVPFSAGAVTKLAHEWLRFILPLAGKIRKVLVMDLDNTLWGGTVGEDGMPGIELGSEYPGAYFLAVQRTALDLASRGILLALCSKNNESDAMAVLRDHPAMLLRPCHLAAWRINWKDKVLSLRELAAELKLGLDTFAFLDDSPSERALVSAYLPEVQVIDLPDDPSGYAAALRDVAGFERLSLSAEDSSRNHYYAGERARAIAYRASSSLENFWRNLEIEITIAPISAATLPRIVQLIQKTNQFNLTTTRYSERDLARIMRAPEWNTYAVSSRDRFGDSGLIALALINHQADCCVIDNLLLSCRVIGRGIETALLSRIADDARAGGAKILRGKFIATTKNGPSAAFYVDHRFCHKGESDGFAIYELDLMTQTVLWPDWITEHTSGSTR